MSETDFPVPSTPITRLYEMFPTIAIPFVH